MALPINRDNVKRNVGNTEDLGVLEVAPTKSANGVFITADKLIDPRNNWVGMIPYAYAEAEALREKIAQDSQDLTLDIAECRLHGKNAENYEKTRSIVLTKIKTQIAAKIEYSEKKISREVLSEMTLNEVIGLGPMEPLWSDPYINEIMIDGPNRVVIEKNGKKTSVPNCKFKDQKHLLEICQQIVDPLNKSIDSLHPLVDARLHDLSRVNIVHPDIAFDGPIVTIRRYREDPWTMEKYIKQGSIDPDMARDLSMWIAAGCSTIIIGGTSSGKTSVLNSIAGQIPPDTRVVVIEDNRELKLPIHAIYEESRPGALDGSGSITLNDLVINALRQAPDRIIVGEARTGLATLSLLDAFSTGHPGNSTIHANSAQAGISRICNMIQGETNRETGSIIRTIADAVNLFVTVSRFHEDGSRRITGIWEIPDEPEEKDGRLSLTPIPLWEYVIDSIDKTPGAEKVHGHYEKRRDISDHVKSVYRIYDEDRPTLNQVIQRSRGFWG